MSAVYLGCGGAFEPAAPPPVPAPAALACPHVLFALFALCARCFLCSRPARCGALVRRWMRLRRATTPPSPLSLTLRPPPSFPLCHFEPTVAELVVIALRWLHFLSLSSLLRLGYVSDAFAARIPTFLRAKNVARFDLEETMTEGSDVAANYSSDGSEDRCEAVIGLVFICAITACAAL